MCETGRDGLTIAFPNDNINPWRQTFRAEITAQAIATPEVGKIIYSLGTDTASWLANFKSLVAQQPDVIVMDSIFGSAIAPAVQQAKAAGIVVVEAETPASARGGASWSTSRPCRTCAVPTPKASEQVVEQVGEDGSYGLYTGIPGNASAANWQPCVTEGFESTPGGPSPTRASPSGPRRA